VLCGECGRGRGLWCGRGDMQMVKGGRKICGERMWLWWWAGAWVASYGAGHGWQYIESRSAAAGA